MYSHQTTINITGNSKVTIRYEFINLQDKSSIESEIKIRLANVYQWFDMTIITLDDAEKITTKVLNSLKSKNQILKYHLAWEWNGQTSGQSSDIVWYVSCLNGKKLYYLSEYDKLNKKASWSSDGKNALIFNSETMAKKFQKRARKGQVSFVVSK